MNFHRNSEFIRIIYNNKRELLDKLSSIKFFKVFDQDRALFTLSQIFTEYKGDYTQSGYLYNFG